jgi:hypothetical protein
LVRGYFARKSELQLHGKVLAMLINGVAKDGDHFLPSNTQPLWQVVCTDIGLPVNVRMSKIKYINFPAFLY